MSRRKPGIFIPDLYLYSTKYNLAENHRFFKYIFEENFLNGPNPAQKENGPKSAQK
jgi:hypothetical protein